MSSYSVIGGGVYAVVLKRNNFGSDEAIKINMRKSSGYTCMNEYDAMMVASKHPYGCRLRGWILEGIRPETSIDSGKTVIDIATDKDKGIFSDDDHDDAASEYCHVGYPIARMHIYTPMSRVVTTKTKISVKKMLFAKILLFLEYFHSQGFIHADIKVDNVLVEQTRTTINPRLIDFGIAQRIGTFPSHYINAPVYRPPEVYAGKEYGYNVDIWAVACMFVLVFTRKFIITSSEKNIPAEIERKLNNQNRRTVISTLFFRTTRTAIPPQDFSLLCDLLSDMLNPDFRKRPSATQCLNHEYFRDLRETLITPMRQRVVDIPKTIQPTSDMIPRKPRNFIRDANERVHRCFRAVFTVALEKAPSIERAADVAWAIALNVYGAEDELIKVKSDVAYYDELWSSAELVETCQHVIKQRLLFGA